ncbi:MAG TPA: DNA-3-methyladenine glycosylase [Candidatus Nitrosotenuis sp.]|nr:DNA-3-methyladenine glycosylase [Candidatus Nitrosotenuis sp.]
MHDNALTHLSEHDPILATLIDTYGYPTIAPHQNYYQELVESIIGQQLSLAAAASITARFLELYEGAFPTPQQILETDVETFRSVGFSRPKAHYVRDLAQHVIDGTIKFDHIDALSNQEIIEELTAVKGIGVWTVHMFLIFCVGRADILAYGDLGVRNGIMALYGFDHQPTKDEVESIASKNNWHPYESIACWYVWRSLENTPAVSI